MWDVAATAAADVGCGVLAVAGAAKVHEPAPFRDFASRTGLALGAGAVRAAGVAEIGIAAAALVVGGRAAFAVVAAAYAGFAAVAAVARAGGAPSCGCFGASSAPPSWTHVVLDVLVAVGAGGAAATDARPLVDRVDGGAGVGYVLFAVLATALVVILMTTAADLADVRRTSATSRPAPSR
jgi:hypothetical protein